MKSYGKRTPGRGARASVPLVLGLESWGRWVCMPVVASTPRISGRFSCICPGEIISPL